MNSLDDRVSLGRLITNCKRILKGIENNFDRELIDVDVGICSNLLYAPQFGRHSKELYENTYGGTIAQFYESWPHYSGNDEYPIPCTDIADAYAEDCIEFPESWQYSQRFKWEGKQLELRIDLLKHIINKAKLWEEQKKSNVNWIQ